MNLLAACLILVLTPGHISRVIDADTFTLFDVDLPAEERIRLLGVDAPEIRDSLGPVARTYTVEWLMRGPFVMEACKRDSFGRLLATVVRGSDTLAVSLVRAGLGIRR